MIHETFEEAFHDSFDFTFSAIPFTPDAGCFRLETAVCSVMGFLFWMILHFADLPLVLTVIVPVRTPEPVFAFTRNPTLPFPLPLVLVSLIHDTFDEAFHFTFAFTAIEHPVHAEYEYFRLDGLTDSLTEVFLAELVAAFSPPSAESPANAGCRPAAKQAAITVNKAIRRFMAFSLLQTTSNDFFHSTGFPAPHQSPFPRPFPASFRAATPSGAMAPLRTGPNRWGRPPRPSISVPKARSG